ncbi:hypothetical protein [Numidum massiliense]|uniref:hypothetical protein n=1 Tax=Numidum massiliense TaxID=1522315 RepID=UPI0011CC0F44|nr:hypothetical protein [Numidum massiliense]
MSQKFPLFCYTASRTCPEPDTTITLSDLIDSPPDITALENELGRKIRQELRRLGPAPLRRIPRSKKRPSIECRILNFK